MKKLILIAMFILGSMGAAQAAILDLSALGSSDTANGAVFSRSAKAGQGTGNFDPFLETQETGNGDGIQEGYNTDGTPYRDTKSVGNWTHSILLTQIPQVTVTGYSGTFYEFILNANDNRNMRIESLEFYLLNAPAVPSYPFSELPKWTLGANVIDLPNVNGGGKDDMYAYIPTGGAFSADPDQYLYLYTKYSSAENKQQWGIDPTKTPGTPGTPSNPVPEPATMLLFGMGLAGMGVLRSKQGKA